MALMVERYEEIVSEDSHKAVPAPFLTKTYKLVDDPCTDHIVSWGEEDSTFVIWRPPEFATDLLPNYFKHNNFSSFVRQLNTYGFRKIAADRWEFANEFFRRGEKHLLSEIRRRKSPHTTQFPNYHHDQTPLIQSSNHEMGFNWIESPFLSPPNAESDPQFLAALTEDNQRLRRRNSLLLSELTHMKKLYNDIIYFLQNHVTPISMEKRPSNEGLSLIHQMGPPHFNALAAPSLKRVPLIEMDPPHLRFVQEPSSSVKLFGVPLHCKKRTTHQE